PREQSGPGTVRALARDIQAPPPALWPEIEHRIGSRRTDRVDEDPVKAGAEEVGLALPDPLRAELLVEIVADHVNHEMTLSGEREAGVVELFLGTFRTELFEKHPNESRLLREALGVQQRGERAGAGRGVGMPGRAETGTRSKTDEAADGQRSQGLARSHRGSILSLRVASSAYPGGAYGTRRG